MTNSDYYTVQELARVLNMHENSIWRKIHKGEIPAVRIGVRGKWLITKRWVESLRVPYTIGVQQETYCRYRQYYGEGHRFCTLREGPCDTTFEKCQDIQPNG